MTRKHWLFLLAVLVQTAILAVVPASRIHTLMTGRTIFLKTAPVDPYDIMAGYYVTLRYEIGNLSKVPGYSNEGVEGPVYIFLTEGSDGAWQATRVDKKKPAADAASKGVFIQGTRTWNGALYGIERYYIPEGKGQEIEEALRKHRNETRVEVRVDSSGHAALVSLHIGSKVYEY